HEPKAFQIMVAPISFSNIQCNTTRSSSQLIGKIVALVIGHFASQSISSLQKLQAILIKLEIFKASLCHIEPTISLHSPFSQSPVPKPSRPDSPAPRRCDACECAIQRD